MVVSLFQPGLDIQDGNPDYADYHAQTGWWISVLCMGLRGGFVIRITNRPRSSNPAFDPSMDFVTSCSWKPFTHALHARTPGTHALHARAPCMHAQRPCTRLARTHTSSTHARKPCTLTLHARTPCTRARPSRTHAFTHALHVRTPCTHARLVRTYA